MPEKQQTKWQKFKRFLKRNMTPTWAKHFAYQVFAFLVSCAMIAGVATYAFTKSYDGRKLSFVEDFTITAHTGAFETKDNTLESISTAIEKGITEIEIDIRQRPDGTLVMGHDIIVSNSDGVELSSAFEIIRDTDVRLNLDIKETRVLKTLRDMLIEYDLMNRVVLTGIDSFQVKAVKENCPDVDYYINNVPSRIKIFSDDYQTELIEELEETGAIGINCNFANASRTLSDLLHKNGYKLSIWTLDTTRQMKRALIIKPDNITTRNPDKLKRIIDNWGK
ncbi:MAG: glycerophosphodiester phosphodiesterase [Eubacterium sp.]|nr:glycerophosphodiester phosphodiesterase [Eubacterium sp.]